MNPETKARKARRSRLETGQSDRFIEAARRLECDDDKARFEKRLGKIAKAKPKGEKPKP